MILGVIIMILSLIGVVGVKNAYINEIEKNVYYLILFAVFAIGAFITTIYGL